MLVKVLLTESPPYRGRTKLSYDNCSIFNKAKTHQILNTRITINTIIKTSTFTILALVAFAANSVLCRLALDTGAIDASSFTIIRLFSGSIALYVIISVSRLRTPNYISSIGSWSASLMLFIYAVTFSYAYISLDTGTGALILFGSVQITMICISIVAGTKIGLIEWAGIGIAFAGFFYLILPGISTPSTNGFLLMTVAGIAWGSYTLLGRNSVSPLMDTGYNFFRTLPFIMVLALITSRYVSYTTEGIVLAMLSGAITSGIGYTIWYIALTGLSSTQAAVLQLSVPVLAAFGGVLFVSEEITSRLIISCLLMLGGILLVIIGKSSFSQA